MCNCCHISTFVRPCTHLKLNVFIPFLARLVSIVTPRNLLPIVLKDCCKLRITLTGSPSLVCRNFWFIFEDGFISKVATNCADNWLYSVIIINVAKSKVAPCNCLSFMFVRYTGFEQSPETVNCWCGILIILHRSNVFPVQFVIQTPPKKSSSQTERIKFQSSLNNCWCDDRVLPK